MLYEWILRPLLFRLPPETAHHLAAGFQCIHAKMGHGPVAAFTRDGDIETEHGCHQNPIAHAHGPFGNIGPNMSADGIIDLGIIHHTGFDHRQGPAGTFLGRLKDQPNGAGELIR